MIAVMVAAIPLLVLFAITQRARDLRDGFALVPPSLFQERSFLVGLIALLILFSGLASLFLVLNYGLQVDLGWSLVKTALTGIGITLTSGIAKRLAATHGRLLTQIGLLVMAAGTIALIFFRRSRAGAGGHAENFVSAASTTLWYNAGAFLIAAALTPLLPGARYDPSQTREPVTVPAK